MSATSQSSDGDSSSESGSSSDNGSFQTLCIKSFTERVSHYSWSPSLDLLAVIIDCNQFQLFRLDGQRVFSPITVDDSISAICWRFDGRAIVLGYECGAAEVRRIDNGDILHDVSHPDKPPNCSISRMLWYECTAEDLEDIGNMEVQIASELRKAPASEHVEEPTIRTKLGPGRVSTEVETIVDPYGEQKFSILLVSYSNDSLHLFVSGILHIGGWSMPTLLGGVSSSKVASIAGIHASGDGTLLNILLEASEDGAQMDRLPLWSNGPMGESNMLDGQSADVRGDVKKSLYALELNVGAANSIPLMKYVSHHYQYLHYSARRMQTCIAAGLQVWNQWVTTQRQIVKDLDETLHNHNDKIVTNGGGPKEAILAYLTHSLASEALQQFFSRTVTVGALKKWRRQFETSIGHIKALLSDVLEPLLEHMMYRSTRISGTLDAIKFSSASVQLVSGLRGRIEALQSCLSTLSYTLSGLANRLVKTSGETGAFFSWLRFSRDRYGDEGGNATSPVKRGKFDVTTLTSFVQQSLYEDAIGRILSDAAASYKPLAQDRGGPGNIFGIGGSTDSPHSVATRDVEDAVLVPSCGTAATSVWDIVDSFQLDIDTNNSAGDASDAFGSSPVAGTVLSFASYSPLSDDEDIPFDVHLPAEQNLDRSVRTLNHIVRSLSGAFTEYTNSHIDRKFVVRLCTYSATAEGDTAHGTLLLPELHVSPDSGYVYALFRSSANESSKHLLVSNRVCCVRYRRGAASPEMAVQYIETSGPLIAWMWYSENAICVLTESESASIFAMVDIDTARFVNVDVSNLQSNVLSSSTFSSMLPYMDEIAVPYALASIVDKKWFSMLQLQAMNVVSVESDEALEPIAAFASKWKEVTTAAGLSVNAARGTAAVLSQSEQSVVVMDLEAEADDDTSDATSDADSEEASCSSADGSDS